MNSYFSHDSNARNSEELIRVRMKHGAAGYGVYFMLIERLRDEDDYTAKCDWDMMAFDLHVESSLVKSVVEDFGLFVIKDGSFYSHGLKKRMEKTETVKSKRAEAGKKGMFSRWNDNSENDSCDNNVIENNNNVIKNDNNVTEVDNKTITKYNEVITKQDKSNNNVIEKGNNVITDDKQCYNNVTEIDNNKIKSNKIKYNPPLTPPLNDDEEEEENEKGKDKSNNNNAIPNFSDSAYIPLNSIRIRTMLSGTEVTEDDATELFRLYDGDEPTRRYVSRYIVSYADAIKQGSDMKIYQIVQALQNIEDRGILHPKVNRKNGYLMRKLRKIVGSADYERIIKIAMPDKMNELEDAMSAVNTKIKMPAAFIISKLK